MAGLRKKLISFLFLHKDHTMEEWPVLSPYNSGSQTLSAVVKNTVNGGINRNYDSLMH